MPGKRKPPPLSFTALTCQFAPETRYLPAGKATRYMGGQAALTLSGGASDEIVCLMRRMAWGVRWPKRAWDRHPFDKGIIRVNQTPADYESGATYELTARELGEGGRLAKAAVDFPPGAESLGWQGTESIRAFPLVRTEDAILLWIRADTGIRDGAIDAVASAKGKRRDWRMAQPAPGPCAYLLLDNLFPGMEQDISLRVSVAPCQASGDLSARHSETLTLRAAQTESVQVRARTLTPWGGPWRRLSMRAMAHSIADGFNAAPGRLGAVSFFI